MVPIEEHAQRDHKEDGGDTVIFMVHDDIFDGKERLSFEEMPPGPKENRSPVDFLLLVVAGDQVEDRLLPERS